MGTKTWMTKNFGRIGKNLTNRLFILATLILLLTTCFPKPVDRGFSVNDNNKETSWARSHIGVQIKTKDPIYVFACRNAIEFYNKVIGRDFIDLDIGNYDIVIKDDNYESPGNGYTEIQWGKVSGTILFADITLPLDSKDDAWYICAHELGHALGLDHDDDPWSLMYPRVSIGRLTDKDRFLLKQRYGTK